MFDLAHHEAEAANKLTVLFVESDAGKREAP